MQTENQTELTPQFLYYRRNKERILNKMRDTYSKRCEDDPAFKLKKLIDSAKNRFIRQGLVGAELEARIEKYNLERIQREKIKSHNERKISKFKANKTLELGKEYENKF